MNYFLDASALVKRYVAEPGSERVRSLSKGRSQLIVSRLTAVEVPAAIWKRTRSGHVSAAGARKIVAQLALDLAQMAIVEPRAATIDLAAELVERHPLRAYDAVQLASAVRWTRETGLATCFVCADRNLASAAAMEGLRRLALG